MCLSRLIWTAFVVPTPLYVMGSVSLFCLLSLIRAFSILIRTSQGVSAVSPIGLTAADALSIAYQAGCHPAVVLFDLSEFNPVVEAHRTGRLVAAMFYHFAMGVAVRRRAASAE
jgi:hypothetical protein